MCERVLTLSFPIFFSRVAVERTAGPVSPEPSRDSDIGSTDLWLAAVTQKEEGRRAAEEEEEVGGRSRCGESLAHAGMPARLGLIQRLAVNTDIPPCGDTESVSFKQQCCSL